MIKVNEYGEITQIMLGREVAGTVYYWTAAYLVDGLLVDTGCAHTAEELGAYLRKKRVDIAVNTHHHEDHVGGNSLLQKERGDIISAHPLARALIARPMELLEYQEMVWGYPEPTVVKRVAESVCTPRHTFRVLHTPGHSPDHISLLEPERGWCFCGDLFVSEKQKVLRADEDIIGIMDSLILLLQLPVKQFTLFTSIGRVYPAGREAVTVFLEHLRQVHRQVVELSGQGLSTDAVRDSIFGRESGLAGLTGGHYSIRNLVEKLISGPA